MTGMFEVLKANVIYTAVAEVDGRWIDGNSGEDVTNGKLLGKFVGSQYRNDGYYRYYRNGNHIYQFISGTNDYLWFCDAAVEDAFKRVWLS